MRRFQVFIALVLAAMFSCSDSDRGAPVLEEFSGILHTDELCNIVDGDTTDFLPRPEGSLDTTLTPPGVGLPLNNSLIGACPNPGDVSTSIHFQLAALDSVWIYAYDEPGAPPIDTLFNDGDALAGSYVVQWNAPRWPATYRVRMFTRRGFESYGDVEFTGPQP